MEHLGSLTRSLLSRVTRLSAYIVLHFTDTELVTRASRRLPLSRNNLHGVRSKIKVSLV